MVDFFAIARRCLQPLADRGFAFWDESLCRCDRLECNRGELEIRVSYESYCAPWCDIHEAGRFVRRVDVKSKFTTSEALAEISLGKFHAMQSCSPSELMKTKLPEPSFRELALLEKHGQEIAEWCGKLLKILEDEKIVA